MKVTLLGADEIARYPLSSAQRLLFELVVQPVVFGTANLENRYDPTGIGIGIGTGDQVKHSRCYDKALWSQQEVGLKRCVGRA